MIDHENEPMLTDHELSQLNLAIADISLCQKAVREIEYLKADLTRRIERETSNKDPFAQFVVVKPEDLNRIADIMKKNSICRLQIDNVIINLGPVPE